MAKIPEAFNRYHRQIIFPPIGVEGQEALAAATAVVVGCGATGSALSNLLARAGVGRLRIIDRDFIELNNLQRQILFDEDDIAAGLPKAEAAARKLRRINRDIEIEGIVADVNPGNILSLLEGATIVLDGADNFSTRFLLNDACISLGLPWVYTGVIASYGMTSTYIPEGAASKLAGERSVTGCLRCLLREMPPPGATPTCDTAGVLGPVVSLLASVAAGEAMKLLTGRGKLNPGVVHMDVWSHDYTVFTTARQPDCPACVERQFEYLNAEVGTASSTLCGRNAVQVTVAGASKLNLAQIERQLAHVATKTQRNDYLLKAQIDGYEFTVFPDNRAIIKGTEDEDLAKTLYARYIGDSEMAKRSTLADEVPAPAPVPVPVTMTAAAGDLDAIAGGYHGAPFAVLGPQVVRVGEQERLAIRAFRPLDAAVSVVDVKNGRRYPMRRVHEAGIFEAVFPQRRNAFAYRLVAADAAGNEFELEDPYRFPPLFTDFDLHLFGEGNLLYGYEKFGAHIRTVEGVQGVHFAVWAPNAARVAVSGSFNGWDNRTHAMRRHDPMGVWEIFVPNLVEGTHYKYAIRSRFLGYEVDKADPYGFYFEMRPSTDARVWDVGKYAWGDEAWLASREARQRLDRPLNIYEVHLGSWRRVPENNGFLSYRDLAEQLVEYVLRMGYTHIELLPITEHPYDGSWGYQTTGYFAPSSRFGNPDEFKYFVDQCHQNGIGVILDWVPGHFPRDAHGLGFFDGTHLYEHADPRQGEQRDWGTMVFNFGRNEVRNFLLSSALFWLKEYHLDGLRVDAVASMLYLDFSRQPGEWIPNRYGGRENLEAISFLRRFNELTHAEAPGTLTIAEESTSWPLVSRPVYAGGLGFDLKWNMGWMHDMLDYMALDPLYRRSFQNLITFSMMYAFSENFVLPFSHDEVVHLKRSMLDKMPGDVWQKFANLRALYAYMAAHPGKKLLFMGGEFGQWREWNEAHSLDWHLLQGLEHQRLQACVAALNALYRNEAALHEVDSSWEGFEWIDISDANHSIISFVRRAADRSKLMVVVCNFTPVPRIGYRVGLPLDGLYDEVFNSDGQQFGGSGVGNGAVTAEAVPWQRRGFSAMLRLPPLGVIYLKPRRG